MQHKLLLWVTALAVAFGSMAGLAVRTARAEVTVLPIVISAVQITGGEGATNHDFIELYNPNPYPVDLNGYRLVKRSALGITDSSIKSFSTQTLVPAYSFYLWANSGWADIGVTPDTTTSATLAADNGVGLRNGALDTGELIDSLAWGETDNSFTSSDLGNPAASESIVRQDLFEDLGYQILPSEPRNSSVTMLPDNVPDLVNGASCSLESGSVQASTNQSVLINLHFTNSGSTIWDDSTYVVKQNAPEGSAEINLGSNINPFEELNLAVTIIAPTQSGQYAFQWQMSTAEEQFGEICNFTISVAANEPNDDPEPSASTIRITEFLPNPVGEDNGFEQVELHNYGNSVVNLENWVLDDVSGTPISSNALTLGPQSLGAGQYLAIIVPAGKFGLNNSGGDVLSLFNSTGQLVSTAAYTSTAPEGKSYSLIDGSWYWTQPSLGLVNPALPTDEPEDPSDDEPQDEPNPDPEPVLAQLKISELYPAPNPSQKEFIEIYNSGTGPVNLANYKLVIGPKSQTLPDISLEANAYYVLTDSELKLPLADAGKLVQLQNQAGEVIDQVIYPKAKKGQSYAWFEDGYLWTTAITPGEVNQLELENNPSTKVVKGTVKTASTNSSKATSTPNSAVNSSDSQSVEPESVMTAGTKNKPNIFSAMAIGAASLSAGVYALYKFGIVGL